MTTPLALPERLTDGVLVLDGHTPADAEAHWAGEDDEMLRRFESSANLTLEHTRSVMLRWQEARANGGPNFPYALRVDGVLAGGCEVRWLERPEGALNLSYWCYPAFRGRGLIGRAVALVVKAVASLPGARQIEAHVDFDNAASRGVAERARFQEQGTVVDKAANGEGLVTRVRYVKPLVHGVDLDEQARCAHWRSKLDIIAIRMKCCETYYACKDCHDALAGHDAAVWPRGEWDTKAVLCGACGEELSVWQYLDCNNVCPACGAGFNPGCRNHYHFYF
ncbi:MAG: GNAT family N-acetyltransferase, partial [Alphaproteobacteria bacterium]|nr:GNAT family N-acetyltransferase [Alphaproteobacteria bacterium]